MVRNVLLLLCFHLISSLCSSQKVVDPVGQVVLPSGPWADTVIVAYDPLQPIGTVQAPGAARPEYLLLREHPAMVLKRLLGTGLSTDPNAERLVLKVNRLHLDEVGENSTGNMHAEVLRSVNGQFIRIHESPAFVQIERTVAGTKYHEANLIAVVQEFLNDFEACVDRGGLTAIPLSESQLSAPMAMTETEAPIIATNSPRRGLYRNYLQMRMNEPDSLFEFELREAGSALEENQMVKLKNVPDAVVDTYWGLCDGTHSYIRVRRTFVRLDRGLGGFQARLPPPDNAEPAAVIAGGILFGMLGAAAIIAANAQETGPLLCDLDLLCGELIPRSAMAAEATYTMQIFQLPKFARTDDPVSVQVPGMATVVLSRGEWTSFQLPLQADPLFVTVTGPRGSQIIEMDVNTERTDIHLLDLKWDGSLRVSRMKDHLRLATLHELKEEDRVP